MSAPTLYKMRVTENQKEAWINWEESKSKIVQQGRKCLTGIRKKKKTGLAKGCGVHFA